MLICVANNVPRSPYSIAEANIAKSVKIIMEFELLLMPEDLSSCALKI